MRIFCPVVYYLVLGACGIQESDVKIKGTAANCVVLASAIMCRLRKPKRRHCTTGFLQYCRSWQLNPRSARKVKAFCNQASNTSSPCEWHSKVLKYLWSTHVNNIGIAQPIMSSLRWRMEVFKIQGLSASVSFLFLSHPPLSFFLVLAPFSTQTKHWKSCSSVFLCFQTPQKRLLHRLIIVPLKGQSRDHHSSQNSTGLHCLHTVHWK